ncbi:zinc finger A20 and AN1 domain-containing stress-associated protein 5-like [Typha latifolia]|uniref:zinc finger A20 and AN1 domain-containing stress-associated protein 5-like n=1 Tax=Typha latifolia TaxID=4733 RepID=UPI003C2EFB5C
MAQREEETELGVPETLTLAMCVNNCGFYGNPSTNNMCQACFISSSSPHLSSGHEKPRSVQIRSPDRAISSRKRAADQSLTVDSTPAKAFKVNRCSGCRKRVGLTGFRCRCGELFCGEHRYSDRHVCGFDYKAAGREAIARENPVVRASKIIRL